MQASVHHVLKPIICILIRNSCRLHLKVAQYLPPCLMHISQSKSLDPSPSSMALSHDVILTQSQMLKMPDKYSFIQSQRREIDGLIKFDIRDMYPIKSLSRSAKLLSSIRSYPRKRLPNLKLLKYKLQGAIVWA